LVEVVGRFASVLEGALRRLEVCSIDPVCADHNPFAHEDDRATHGAACHGCLLIAETSCEARNLFLDRALLLETMAEPGAAFFRLQPGLWAGQSSELPRAGFLRGLKEDSQDAP